MVHLNVANNRRPTVNLFSVARAFCEPSERSLRICIFQLTKAEDFPSKSLVRFLINVVLRFHSSYLQTHLRWYLCPPLTEIFMLILDLLAYKTCNLPFIRWSSTQNSDIFAKQLNFQSHRF